MYMYMCVHNEHVQNVYVWKNREKERERES